METQEKKLAENEKYCKHCASIIDKDCVVCPKCGKQVEELAGNNDKNIFINNSAAASAASTVVTPERRKKKYSKLLDLILIFFHLWTLDNLDDYKTQIRILRKGFELC